MYYLAKISTSIVEDNRQRMCPFTFSINDSPRFVYCTETGGQMQP